MTFLLSQLFSPATLLASAVFAPNSDPSLSTVEFVRTRLPEPAGIHQPAVFALENSRLLDTVFGLPPMTEERPYAL
jgi:hypothetical protein